MVNRTENGLRAVCDAMRDETEAALQKQRDDRDRAWGVIRRLVASEVTESTEKSPVLNEVLRTAKILEVDADQLEALTSEYAAVCTCLANSAVAIAEPHSSLTATVAPNDIAVRQRQTTSELYHGWSDGIVRIEIDTSWYTDFEQRLTGIQRTLMVPAVGGYKSTSDAARLEFRDLCRRHMSGGNIDDDELREYLLREHGGYVQREHVVAIVTYERHLERCCEPRVNRPDTWIDRLPPGAAAFALRELRDRYPILTQESAGIPA